jgi:hypothetical protein
MKQKLLMTERKILRRIFGPSTDRDGTWRIETNDELNNLIRNKNISNYNMTQRLSLFGHVHQRTNDRMVKKLNEWKPISTRLAGRPEIRRENIKKGLRIMQINRISLKGRK